MYELLEHRNVQKELAKVPANVKEQYEELRKKLKEDPNSCIDKQLKGFHTPTYSNRIGDYRVLFTINNKEITVFVITIAHRGKVYSNKK